MSWTSITEGVALTAAGVAATASVLVDAALRPQSQVFGRTLVAPKRPDEVVLTYDDGPNDRATEELLELFAEHEVCAAFFMIGRFVRERKALARRVLAAGHIVGNHTMTHPWLAWQSGRRIREELRVCNEILEDTLGERVRYFRPPHGARRPLVLRYAEELGLTVVQWNVMGLDWNPIGAGGILKNLRRDLARVEARGRGANILLHDGGDLELGTDRSDTVTATAELLRELPAKGKRFVSLDAWAPAAV